MTISRKGLCKQVCKVVGRRNLIDGDGARPEKFTYIVVSYINMLDLSVVLGILRKRYCPLIITFDYAQN